MLSDILKHRRMDIGITQQEVADKLNVTRQTVSSWETGKSIPDISMMVSLSEFYTLSLDYMLKGGSSMKKFYIVEKAMELKNFSVTDEEGKVRYKADKSKQILPSPAKFTIYDSKDKRIGRIIKHGAVAYGLYDQSRYEILVNGWQTVWIRRIIKQLSTAYEVDGEGLAMKGNWLSNHFEILKDKREVAQVNKKLIGDKKFFEIELFDDYIESLVVCFMIAIDFIRGRESFAERNGEKPEKV